jgi:pimeloyl-ACP methyl ester carboxylesterase
MDVRGYGGSSANWPDYSTASVGADLLGLIHHLNGDAPATVIAHSIGCSAAVWAAAETPRAIDGLVLIGTFLSQLRRATPPARPSPGPRCPDHGRR